MWLFDERVRPGWNADIFEMVQSSGYASAMEAMNYRTCFASSSDNSAVMHIRGDGGILAPLVKRATVFLNRYDEQSIRCIAGEMARRNVPFVRFGNSMWGADNALELNRAGARITECYTFLTDLGLGEEKSLSRMHKNLRRDLRKGKRSDVRVWEAKSMEDIRNYHAISLETTRKARAVKSYTYYPPAFFERLLVHMVRTGQAFILLAGAEGRVLSGGIFFVSGKKALYYHGCSLRNPENAKMQAPTVLLHEAQRVAKEKGCDTFDWGGVDPYAPQDDSVHHIYRYKKKWGGDLVRFYNGELALSKGVMFLQENILIPAYSKLLVLKNKLNPLENK